MACLPLIEAPGPMESHDRPAGRCFDHCYLESPEQQGPRVRAARGRLRNWTGQFSRSQCIYDRR